MDARWEGVDLEMGLREGGEGELVWTGPELGERGGKMGTLLTPSLAVKELLRYYGSGRGGQNVEDRKALGDVASAGEGLETMGFQVGCQLVERYSRNHAKFEDTLEIVKFLCKDFWIEVFRKQIDNLKTNHRVRPNENIFISTRCLIALTHVSPGSLRTAR